MKFDKIKILHLEDDKLDFDHISGILNSELKNIKISWVINKEDFIKSLKSDDFRLLIKSSLLITQLILIFLSLLFNIPLI